MPYHFAFAADVSVLRGITPETPGQRAPRAVSRVTIALDEIDLGAIAGGQQHAFTCAGLAADRVQRGRNLVWCVDKTLAHLDIGGGVAHANEGQRHASASAASAPDSTRAQNPSSSRRCIVASHCASPPASSSRLRTDRNAAIAVAYLSSNRPAIASRMRAAARGTPPADTPTITSPARWVAMPLKLPSLGESETVTSRCCSRAIRAIRELINRSSVAAKTSATSLTSSSWKARCSTVRLDSRSASASSSSAMEGATTPT